MTKFINITLLTILFFMLIILAITWKSPSINTSAKVNIHTCIHNDNKKLYFKLNAQQGVYFYIHLAENSKADCINPYFPSIHIQTNKKPNAWLHIVYIDSREQQWRIFIDSQLSTHPFYTYERDFYDAPIWTYTLFKKPLTFWKGHAFALEIDDINKTINCIGGIEWGFELLWFKLTPKAIPPKMLDNKAWKQAWQIIKAKLPGYTQ
jgi:hypothetical protein